MRDMDVLIVVSASAENQKSRALKRTEMTVEKFELIKSRQMPDDEKRGWAHYLIENNGTLEDLAIQTTAVIENIRERANLHA